MRPLSLAGAGLLSLAAAASLAGPWLSQLEVQSAARIWTRSPQRAYARLEDAARLNPLSDEPYVLAGSIAVRYDEQARAAGELERALRRSPDDAYPTLELGAIASSRGEEARALTLLTRAVALAPREALAREALAVVREHRRIDVGELNRAILRAASEL